MQNPEGSQRTGENEPVNVSVQEGWIKLGFLISNKQYRSGEKLYFKG